MTRALALEPGYEVGPFRLQQRLGSGAMGEVWSARHRHLKNHVAIKFMTLPREGFERFRLEGQVTAQLAQRAPAIVQVFDQGQLDDGTAFLILEYVDGETLEQVFQKRGRLPISLVQVLVDQACHALSEAHAAGVIHRDIKPSNLMVAGLSSERPLLRITDFGVAKAMRTDLDVDQPVSTHEGHLVGTPAYMAPEVLLGTAPAGPASDLWSLACTIYEALTGWPPFHAESLTQLTVGISKGHHDAPSALADGLGADVDRFFSRAFATDPEARFENAEAFASAFAALAEPTAKRRPRWGLGVAATAGLLVLVAGVAAWSSQDGSEGSLGSSDAERATNAARGQQDASDDADSENADSETPSDTPEPDGTTVRLDELARPQDGPQGDTQTSSGVTVEDGGGTPPAPPPAVQPSWPPPASPPPAPAPSYDQSEIR